MARIGVCSWSLQAGSADELAERVHACGLSAVQLALDPLRTGAWEGARTVRAFGEAGIELLSGMVAFDGEDYSSLASIRATGGVRPDATWDENLAVAEADAEIADALGLRLVTLHAGFVPEEAGAERDTLAARLRELVDVFAARDVELAFETGQETAANLARFLDELERPSVGVNFDPANMVLYGMGDPVEALRVLAPRVRQIHVKDATPADVPGDWGAEVPTGTGVVDWDAFFAVRAEAGLEVDLVIEREAGDARVEDVTRARRLIEEQLA